MSTKNVMNIACCWVCTSVEIQTRSGNTGTPDSTWSAWSEVYKDRSGSPVSNERARFLQVRALLSGQGGVSPLLDSVTAPYLQRNLRPQVLSVTVHPPGEVFQKPLTVSSEVEILGLDSPEAGELRPGAKSLRSTFSPTTYSRRLYQRGKAAIMVYEPWKVWTSSSSSTLRSDPTIRGRKSSDVSLLSTFCSEIAVAALCGF